jgi:hypothetical protein
MLQVFATSNAHKPPFHESLHNHNQNLQAAGLASDRKAWIKHLPGIQKKGGVRNNCCFSFECTLVKLV